MNRIIWLGVYRRIVYALIPTAIFACSLWFGWEIALGALLGFFLAVATQVYKEIRDEEGVSPFQVIRPKDG